MPTLGISTRGSEDGTNDSERRVRRLLRGTWTRRIDVWCVGVMTLIAVGGASPYLAWARFLSRNEPTRVDPTATTAALAVVSFGMLVALSSRDRRTRWLVALILLAPIVLPVATLGLLLAKQDLGAVLLLLGGMLLKGTGDTFPALAATAVSCATAIPLVRRGAVASTVDEGERVVRSLCAWAVPWFVGALVHDLSRAPSPQAPPIGHGEASSLAHAGTSAPVITLHAVAIVALSIVIATLTRRLHRRALLVANGAAFQGRIVAFLADSAGIANVDRLPTIESNDDSRTGLLTMRTSTSNDYRATESVEPLARVARRRRVLPFVVVAICLSVVGLLPTALASRPASVPEPIPRRERVAFPVQSYPPPPPVQPTSSACLTSDRLDEFCGPIDSAAISRDGQIVVLIEGRSAALRLSVWDRKTLKRRWTEEIGARAWRTGTPLEVDPQARMIALSTEKVTRVYRATDGHVSEELSGCGKGASRYARAMFSSTGTLVMIARDLACEVSFDDQWRAHYKVRSSGWKVPADARDAMFDRVALTPDGNRVWIVRTNDVCAIDLRTGMCVASVKSPPTPPDPYGRPNAWHAWTIGVSKEGTLGIVGGDGRSYFLTTWSSAGVATSRGVPFQQTEEMIQPVTVLSPSQLMIKNHGSCTAVDVVSGTRTPLTKSYDQCFVSDGAHELLLVKTNAVGVMPSLRFEPMPALGDEL